MCRPSSAPAALARAWRAAMDAAVAAEAERKRVVRVALAARAALVRFRADCAGIVLNNHTENTRRLFPRSGRSHFLERGPGNCVQAQDMGFQHVSSCFFVGPILGRTTLMIVLQTRHTCIEPVLALQPEAGSGAGCKPAKGSCDSHLVRPGTYSLAGYHHAIMQLVACVAVIAIARALGALAILYI